MKFKQKQKKKSHQGGITIYIKFYLNASFKNIKKNKRQLELLLLYLRQHQAHLLFWLLYCPG
jgi:hypothetical protein